MSSKLCAFVLPLLIATSAVAETPVIFFPVSGPYTVTGTLRAGQPLTIHYALDRLKKCRATYSGMDTWLIAVEYRFDYGTFQEAYVTNTSGYRREPVPATITAPAGARTLELRFRNWDRGGCVAYDPSSWPIYTFTLQQ
ncbi:DUF6209 family protein [Archangium lipolyticum]|uniref:DUF6209 family protein n=1 Tax=Archangium lipolyticum TaxID=2970465 RepID=UPI00214A16B1|nr:DUF6209 family protein [Archangium lipolyticum]